MSFSYSPKIVTDGLVFAVDAANKKSYSGSGTVWNDLSGNGNNGTLINGPTFDSENGGSINFDGSNDRCDFTTFSTSNYYDLLNSPFSVNFWIKFPIAFPTSNEGVINTQQYFTESQTNSGGFGISVTSTGFILLLTEAVDGSSSNSMGMGISYTSLNLNEWYNICVSYSYGNVKTYLNTSNTVTSTSNRSWSTTTLNRLRIGSSTQGGWGSVNASISNVMIYNKTLSSTEVTQNYNALKGRYM